MHKLTRVGVLIGAAVTWGRELSCSRRHLDKLFVRSPGTGVVFIRCAMTLLAWVLTAFSTVLPGSVYVLIQKIRGKNKSIIPSPLEAASETELVLKSRRVGSDRLLESGFTFPFAYGLDAARSAPGWWERRCGGVA